MVGRGGGGGGGGTTVVMNDRFHTIELPKKIQYLLSEMFFFHLKSCFDLF